MAMEILAEHGNCSHCGRTDLIILRDRQVGGTEFTGCAYCLGGGPTPAQPPEQQAPAAQEDAPLPQGMERLSRAIEELSREIRITRGFVATVLSRMEEDGPLDETPEGGTPNEETKD